MAQPHDPHHRPTPWLLISVFIYGVIFLGLLAGAYFIGGVITAGFDVWFGAIVVHAFLYVCINRKSKEH